MSIDTPVPDPGEFRARGANQTRIETFTDAAFAFALTMLAVSLEAPTTYEALMRALGGIPAFAGSFALLMLFWRGHNEFSRRYGLEDGTTLLLTSALVFVLLVYVFPLKFLFKAFVAWMAFLTTGEAVGEELRISIGQLKTLFIVYGGGFTAMTLCLMLLFVHAYRLRRTLGLNEVEVLDTRLQIGAWGVQASVGLLSIAIAALPISGLHPSSAGWAYCLLPIVMPIYGIRSGRKRDALVARLRRAAASAA